MIKCEKEFEGYIIESDGTQYTLSKKITSTNKKTGEKYENKDIVGYYGTITSVFRGLHKDVMLGVVKDTDLTLKEALDKSTAVWERIEKELKGW